MSLPKPTREHFVLFNILKGDTPSDLEGINTQALFDLFKRHRLFPLTQEIIGLLPEDEQLRWKKALQSGSLRTLHLVNNLQELLRLFNKQGIIAIPLKGPALAYMLYGDFGQRHMRDLDLLIENGDILAAAEALKDAGYTSYIPSGELNEGQWRYYFRHQYDITLISSESRNIIELHSGIAYPGFLNSEVTSLLEDLQELELPGISLSCLSKESTFLYLAIHGAHHLYFRLFWLRDLAEALQRWELDHQVIFDKAGLLGIERMVAVSLNLAQSYFGIEIPIVWKKYLKEHSSLMNRLEKMCHRIIGDPEFLSRRNRLNVLFFTLMLKPGFKHRWISLSTLFHRWYIKRFLLC